MSPSEDIQISILIASIGRAELLQTISSARTAALRCDITFEIVVADDSIDGKALALLEREGVLDEHIVVTHSASQNIAIARNQALEQAKGTYLAFIDDDEWAEEHWLTAHLRILQETRADASFGPVKAHYAANAPSWIKWSDVCSKSPGPTLWDVRQLSTANCLIRHGILTDHEIRFDPAKGRSGGEDSDVFNRLRDAGAKFVVAKEALVHERWPIARCSASDLLRRSLRVGQTYAEQSSRDTNSVQKIGLFLKAVAAATVNFGLAIALAATFQKRFAKRMLNCWANLGKAGYFLPLPRVENYYSAKKPTSR